ncbi:MULTISPECIES: Ohr family peroxiredoxin [Pseudomonas]|uniref:Peroxiredoxin, Ohr subfamily n=1 Tax=Pseudomonas segetis TaxID=298908 RepID=A0A239HMN1_9PSED|nr:MULTISPECIES: Ohr family peroxiredoxin [Pseudomonas]SNS82572.1 peroxiredoxin, Ohr subfamily [Pseudomonas segetis]
MISIAQTLYTGHTHTTGGREGEGRSLDGRLNVKLSPPGAPGSGCNPEQLFAIAWSASFIGALRHACNARKIGLPQDTSVDAQIDFVCAEQGFFLQARLAVYLPEFEADVAQELMDAAYHNCPYTKATQGNIDVSILRV